ncbi:uncharacterized protein LOC118205499, partial [Stegodyphus dumicola]|uniref:uncharacterized protein LOC118205499 n=1 Tax=Stegodyphus dumicola TaxID=202533 RepID=UPI0015AD5B7D
MDIRTVIFLFSVFVFFTCHSWAQDQSITDCEAEWNVNVTWDKMFVVQWSGLERKADVRIKVSADSSRCTLKDSWFPAPFSERLLKIPLSCSNSEHEFIATIFCNDTEVNEKIINDVWAPPDAPTNITLENATEESLDIGWEAPFGNVIEYKVWLEAGASKHEYASKDASINITGLSPYTEYTVRVQAKNHLWSELSDALKTRTEEG